MLPKEGLSIFEEYTDLCDPTFVEEYDLPKCMSVVEKDGPLYELDVAVALLRSEGNLTKAACILRRSRRVVDGFVSRNLALSDLLLDIKGMFLDKVEEQSRLLAAAGDGSMVRFVLSTLGKERGYTTRAEVSGKDGEALNVHFFLPENNRDKKEEVTDGD